MKIECMRHAINNCEASSRLELMVPRRDMSINDYTLAEESALIVNFVNPLNECMKMSKSGYVLSCQSSNKCTNILLFLFVKYNFYVTIYF